MVACRTTLLQRHKVRQPHIFGKSKFQFLGRPAPSTAAGGPRRQGPWRLRCSATLLRQMKNVRPIFAASSSVRTEPSVRHVQTDHDSAYNDQNNRDQCQLKPAKRCCPFKHRAPVDFTTKPSPCNRVRDRADDPGRPLAKPGTTSCAAFEPAPRMVHPRRSGLVPARTMFSSQGLSRI